MGAGVESDRVPAADVVVPVHNGWDLTKRCLHRLRGQTIAHNTIVVDNGSTDGTPDCVRRGFPEVRVLELGANLGFSAACNRGVEAGSGDVVVLVNNDVECGPDFLKRLVSPLRRDDEIGSVAALLLQPGEQRIESFGVAADPTLAGFPRLRHRPTSDLDGGLPVLAGPSGAAGAYRRAAWEQVRGLDEGVFAYGEDVDLALRLQAAGWRAAEAPDAVAIHIGSATSIARSQQQRYHGGFARGYFMRRYGVLLGWSAPRALATEGIVVAGDALVYSHDLAALRGRVAGWRAAAGAPRRPHPPDDAVDRGITFVESLRLRRSVYTCM
jgi:N-acetylglucosaminyl-diphospho-decaprenol L-rhamnosyltransferase